MDDVHVLLERLAEARDDDERAAAEVALGEHHRDQGEPEAALRYLSSARRRLEARGRGAEAARVDVVLADVCASRGEPERGLPFLARALVHAERAGDDALRAQVALAQGEAALHRGDAGGAAPLVEAALASAIAKGDRAMMARARATLARVRARTDDPEAARALIELARGDAAATDRAAVKAHVAMADAALHELSAALYEVTGDADAPGGLVDAIAPWREAMELARTAGLRRVEAEASLALGLALGALGERGADVESPASHLARAHELYRTVGGLRDLDRVREAFRRFGRRATDRVQSVELAPLLGELRERRRAVEQAAARLAAEAEAGGDVTARLELDEQLRELGAASERLAGAANAVVVDRENIRGLLELIRALAQITDFAALPDAVARLASQLVGGDRALVELDGGHRGAVGMVADEPGPWHAALARARGPAARPTLVTAGAPIDRTGSTHPIGRLGVTLIAPLRAGAALLGAIWVDKEPSGGVFTERDLDLLAAFAVQAAAIVDRARAADELRLAARTTATTLAAIGDGVLAIDGGGRITAINPAAARLLGLPAQSVAAPGAIQLGGRTEALAALLREALARGEELDGRPLAIGAAEHLVSTRLIRDDRGGTAGLVATFTELRRASSLAHRIVGTSARYTLDDLIGTSQAARHVRALAEAAATSDASLLLTGESGTGKEVLAQAVHNASARAGGPFVAVHCAAIPRELLESELFGYDAGAFTGARKGGRPGKFEIAEGGTLLLDEIGDMPLDMQVKLLRVLQEKTVSRLGGEREIPVTCRIIATTNRELDDDVARGLFRRDLYYRLRVIHIALPPLRERPGDIEALTEHFLRRHATSAQKRVTRVAPDVMALLQAHAWPGNVRELEHVIESAVALAPPEATAIGALPVPLGQRTGERATPPTSFPMLAPPGAPPAPGLAAPAPPPPPGGPLPTAADAERDLLIAALHRFHGRIPPVARALGLSRATIYNLVRRHQLALESFRGPAS